MGSDFKWVCLDSVEWAHHVSLSIERSLRKTSDPRERARLRSLRDWHYASLRDEQIKRA